MAWDACQMTEKSLSLHELSCTQLVGNVRFMRGKPAPVMCPGALRVRWSPRCIARYCLRSLWLASSAAEEAARCATSQLATSPSCAAEARTSNRRRSAAPPAAAPCGAAAGCAASPRQAPSCRAGGVGRVEEVART